MSTTTLNLSDGTAWIGEGPKWVDTFPTIIASAAFGGTRRMLEICTWFDRDRFTEWWRDMLTEAEAGTPCRHEWTNDMIQWAVKTTPQKHNQTCSKCGEKRFA